MGRAWAVGEKCDIRRELQCTALRLMRGEAVPGRTGIVQSAAARQPGERPRSAACIEGKNRTRSYEDKQGVKRYVTEVVGEELILLDKKEG